MGDLWKAVLPRDRELTRLQEAARRAAGAFGRDSWLVRALRPAYERALELLSGHNGIPWSINGVSYRVDPHFRQQLSHEYDREVAAFLRTRVRPGSVCFDVGANVGVYVLQFAHWSKPDGRVVAFEPNPATLRVLRKHTAINHLDTRVEIVECAVGAQEGQAHFFSAGEDGMSRLGAPNELIAAKAKQTSVPVTTLDAYCAKRRIEPDWLLIDIEGFEFQALLGAKNLLTRRRGQLGIVIEMHPNVWDSAETTRELAEDLLRGFKLRPVPLVGQTDPLAQHGLVYLEPF